MSANWLAPSAHLALQTLARRWRRYALTTFTMALSLAVYFLGSAYTGAGREWMVPSWELDLPAPFVARTGSSWLPDPVFSPWSVDNGPVDRVEAALSLDALTPLGRTGILFLAPGGETAVSLEIIAGRPPDGPAEMALPEELALAAGLEVGDRLTTVVFYSWNVPARRDFLVVGLFCPQSFVTARPVAAYVGGETTLGPFTGRGLLTGELGDPRFFGTIEEQSRPGARPAVTNLLFVYPSPGASPDQVEEWLVARAAPTALWSTRTPAIRLERMASEITLPAAGVMFFVFWVAGIGVFATTLLGFLERKREFAVYKAVGMDGRALAATLWFEVAGMWLVSLTGGLLTAGLVVRAAGTGAFAATLARVASAAFGLDPGFLAGRTLTLSGRHIVNGGLISGVVFVLAAAFPLALALRASVNDLIRGGRLFLVRHRLTGSPRREIPGLRPGHHETLAARRREGD